MTMSALESRLLARAVLAACERSEDEGKMILTLCI